MIYACAGHGRHRWCRDHEIDNDTDLPSDPTSPDKQRFPGPGGRRAATGGGSQGARSPLTSPSSGKKAVLFVISQLHDDERLVVVGPSSHRLFGETATGFLNIRDARLHAEKSLHNLQPRDGHAQHQSGLKEIKAIKMLSEAELPAESPYIIGLI
ncbi:unnamed protein product [Urochloa humidicola]